MKSVKFEFLQLYNEIAWMEFLKLIQEFTAQNVLQYHFKDPQQFLYRALLVRGSRFDSTYFQRLEFLGDAILSLVISKRLYSDQVDYGEDALTEYRSHLTRNSTLSKVFGKLKINRLEDILDIQLSANQQADLIEALIAAVYLDSGEDITATEQVINQLIDFNEMLADIVQRPWGTKSSKNHLQEMLKKIPAHVETSIIKMGAANAPKFIASIRYYTVDKANTPKYNIIGEPKATKRDAEKFAIEKLLQQLYAADWQEFA